MKIGIYGGAFNPIHNGHIALANHYKDYLNLDRVIFVPTCFPPHKTNAELISGDDRINMLSLALVETYFDLSDMEFRRDGKSYTYLTLLEIKEKYPNDELFLIVGADQYFTFDTWYRTDDIMKLATVVSAARKDGEYQRMIDFKNSNPLMKNTIVSNFEVTDISSSQIRNMIKMGEDISKLVPKKVLEYIKEHKLYV